MTTHMSCRSRTRTRARSRERMVVREALLRLPLIRNIRQFMALGNDLQNAMRKAATVVGEKNYDKAAIAPVVTWATSAQVLDLGVRVETLVNEAVATKEARRACSAPFASFIDTRCCIAGGGKAASTDIH